GWLIALQRSIAQVFGQNLPLSTTFAQILRAIAEASQSDAVLLWTRNGASDGLTCECTWCAKPESVPLPASIGESGIRSATGLPERVLATGEPVWFDNALLTSRAGEHGSIPLLGSAFAFPVRAHGEIAAVVELIRRGPGIPGPDLLELLHPIGLQLGSYLGN